MGRKQILEFFWFETSKIYLSSRGFPGSIENPPPLIATIYRERLFIVI